MSGAGFYVREMEIREELSSDVDAVQEIHRAAFASHADQVVSLVDDLRRSLRSELGLSLVALDGDDQVSGHVLFPRNLLDAPAHLVDVQALSAVGGRPDLPRQGVGSGLHLHGSETLDRRALPAGLL